MSQREGESGGRGDPERVEELYERALALAPEARAAFLADACAGDAWLEQELHSLLEHGEPAEALFARLAEAVSVPPVQGKVGHYQLVGILGTGGMGTVYRAHDTRLDRMVALKFLPPSLGAEGGARERLLLEARAAAALEHPNVCAVHEVGTSPDGRPFIAMACYEGETLRERLDRGPLPPPEAVAIAIQVARGLGAAHARGIIHRDVKPGNVMLCADGSVRLLDFGLAKMADASLTAPGATPGTIAYMSPEQARGDPVTPQTDLWSLGVVLYESLTGVRPFRGGNDRAVIQAIQHDQPEPVRRRATRVSSSLARTVERLLEKRPEARYRSAEALVADLARGATDRRLDAALAWLRMHRPVAAVAGAGLAAAAMLVASPSLGPDRMPARTPAPGPLAGSITVAVLPFAVRGEGLEIWREGMVDLLSRGLDGAAGIRAVDSRTLLAQWRREVPDEAVADLARALGVARQVRANRALLGSAVVAGSQIRLSAAVHEIDNGLVAGVVQVEGPRDSILSLVDRLGVQALQLLVEEEAGATQVLALAGVTTTSLIALNAYLRGEAAYRRSEFHEAARAWGRAVRADSQFALAYLGLTDAYGWESEVMVGGRAAYLAALERASRLASRLPARERALAQVRWARETADPAAATLVRESVRQHPDAAGLWYELGEFHHHDAEAMGSPLEAEQAFRHAAGLQPGVAPFRAHLVDLAFRWHADSTRIAREVAAYRQLAPVGTYASAARIAFALGFGDAAARAGARAEVATLDEAAALQLYANLTHPRFADVRRGIVPVLESLLTRPVLGHLRHQQAMTLSLVDGRAREALALLETPGAPASARYCGPLYLFVRGLPVPRRVLEHRLALARSDSVVSVEPPQVMCAMGYAARLGAWGVYDSLLAGARARAAGDGSSARQWAWAVRAGEGHGLQARGRRREALGAFGGALNDGAGWALVWHVGELALELGELDRAERAFRALWSNRDGVPARLRLARVLERTGRRSEAREAYQYAVDAWRQADAELQPMVEEARRAVVRLSRAGE